MQNEKTSSHQYERMVNLLTEYPDIAQNYTKRSPEIVAVFWEDLANQLNSLGPRQRDVGGWKKVWSDYKSYIKKKLSANKKEIAGTGGGPCRQKSFTPLEDAVIALTNIGSSVSGIGAASFGAGNTSRQVPPAESSTSNTAVSNENKQEENRPSPVQHQNSAENRTRRRRPMTSIQLLTKQIKNQENFYKDTTKTLKRVSRSLEDVCKIEREKLKETQTHNTEMRRIALQKLQLKKRKLEFEIAKANILME